MTHPTNPEEEKKLRMYSKTPSRIEYEKNLYDKFIRNGLNVGFTDDQIDFLWNFIMEELLTN